MQISGERAMKAQQQDVWDVFQDADMLRNSMPGITEFNQIGENEWKGAISLGVGPIKGSYGVKIVMFDQEEPVHYKLAIEGEGGPGWVKAVGAFNLEPIGKDTKVVYMLDAQVGGLVANVGQRMLSGVAKMILGQFFNNMDKLMLTRKSRVNVS